RQQVHENEELLLNILPAPVAASLRDGNGQATQSFADVTVLVAYLLGFEQVSQAEGPDVSLVLMQDLVITFDEAAEQFGVEKVKTVGASYLAVCGLSVQRPDHTNRMIEFARELVRIVQRFNRERGKELVLEIGINCGPVVGGIVGRSKFIYDLWGDTITIASGLKSDGVTSIQVTQAVYERMRDLHSFVVANEFEIKAKGSFRAWKLVE
ncbi:MAG: adenylate/guanylate cyclase domain-containing protein, partial [Candidatus Methylumidiphilus sp.]